LLLAALAVFPVVLARSASAVTPAQVPTISTVATRPLVTAPILTKATFTPPPLIKSVTVNPSSHLLGGISSSGHAVIDASVAVGTPVNVTTDCPSTLSIPSGTTVYAGPAGTAVANFQIFPSVVTSPVTCTVRLGVGLAVYATTVVVSPAPTIASYTLSPSSLMSGAAGTATVTLSAPAPAAGADVRIGPGKAGLVTGVPATQVLTVPGGQTSASFQVVASDQLTQADFWNTSATYAGTGKSLAVSIVPGTSAPAGWTPPSITGSSIQAVLGSDTTVTMAVNFSAPAPSWGLPVTFSSNDPAITFSRARIVAGPGTTSTGDFVMIGTVATQHMATITATTGSSTTQQVVTLKPPVPRYVTFDVSDAFPLQTVNGTVRLSGAAPPGGRLVNLSSNNTPMQGTPGNTMLMLPASVTVAAGATTTSFQMWIASISWAADSDWCVWATEDASTKSCVHTHYRVLDPLHGTSFQYATTHAHAHRGENFNVTFMLSTAAPSMGYPIALSIYQPNGGGTDPGQYWYFQTCGGFPTITGPGSVTVPAGQKQVTATFNVDAASNCGLDLLDISTGENRYPNPDWTEWLRVIDPSRIIDNGS
jgi:hypothetical protein